MSQLFGVNPKEIPSEKRTSAEMDSKINNQFNSQSSVDLSKLNKGNKNSKCLRKKIKDPDSLMRVMEWFFPKK